MRCCCCSRSRSHFWQHWFPSANYRQMIIARRGNRWFDRRESGGFMTSGLLASLSPPQEIALRRIAHGSFVVDAQAAASLIALALVQRTNNGLRLTPLGRLRYDALPKAPL